MTPARTVLVVRPCAITTARIGVYRLHRHRSRPPRQQIAAFEVTRDGWPVGFALVGRPVSRVLQGRGWLEVTRVATDGTRNACSALYGAAARFARRRGQPITTYTLATEPGTSLRAAGWVEVARVRARRGKGWASRPDRAPGDGAAKVRWAPRWCAP